MQKIYDTLDAAKMGALDELLLAREDLRRGEGVASRENLTRFERRVQMRERQRLAHARALDFSTRALGSTARTG